MEKNTKRLRMNMVAWLSYFFTGALVSTLGLVIGPVSTAFGKDPGFIGQIFTLMNLGLFLPILLSGILMRRFGLGRLLIAGSIITLLTCAALFLQPTLLMFSIGVTMIGATAGIMMAIGSYLVVRINEDPKLRSANLIFTDLFFALAGVTLSVVLGYLFRLGANWLTMYAIMGMLAMLMILLCLGQPFPSMPKQDAPLASTAENPRWGAAAWLLCCALFAFLLAEPIFTMWLPSWLKQQFALGELNAAYYITTYWTVKSIGLFINQFTVRFVQLRTYLLLSTLGGMISLGIACNSQSPGLILLCAGLFGFCNSGLFSGLMSYGSLQVKNSPPTLTSALLTIGTMGTLRFSSVSSFAYSRFGLYWALNSSTLAYGLLLVLLMLASLLSRAERLHLVPRQEDMPATPRSSHS
ncbi:MFS transporter TsgA [Aquitalea aquatilis]|uniref:MFS transporter TsgA n=1 Tax=Aquitalea aquatilis TaxID=1537400 RepID=UPI0010BD5720|nr:MFS transporter TsgA [Aquitalea aquatilis]